MGNEANTPKPKQHIPRSFRRNVDRADAKLKEFVSKFFEKFKYNEEEHDWSIKTGWEFEWYDNQWKLYCAKKRFFQFRDYFKLSAYTLRIQCILQSKYQGKASIQTIQYYIKKYRNTDAQGLAAKIIADNKFEIIN
ncbi:MAG: hypothetical protein A2X13_14555 [Bacteroidetes bacterium GWC2_33_15]|nr:MAG: hypothetical protein A2X10_12600 [Bacteroidetes bacterium GWA2_33_15]OFX50093.1 MAG: hypothetical protein A2X13_14555 [Bacteroidetes bacterium GWC2_33_15]OFX65246.1 MAG: hypothetical protein A2X15_04130 [Bacteroidetes bacterium GWB2_32_14]OFX70472.1 MAG: hypothetical protein A2X14_04185 [Bacteroidetes bacterium GWD2_33_33]HAN19655.1 hypothetical protein [Bacteroidales bacterium]